MKLLWVINLILMLVGYIWWMQLDRPLKDLVRTLSMQAYFIVTLYYFLCVVNAHRVARTAVECVFELGIVLQLLTSSGYWMLIHPETKYTNMLVWNMYMHSIPLICHLATLLLSQVRVQNRLWLLSLFALGIGFPINYGFSQFDEKFYPPHFSYDSFPAGLFLFSIVFSVLCLFSTLLYWATTKLHHHKQE